ncbi:alpha/beta-hydrolase [Hymenopellis radicata]|nr:alpha/beta-hydrolase [Hymenopellis radicata]
MFGKHEYDLIPTSLYSSSPSNEPNKRNRKVHTTVLVVLLWITLGSYIHIVRSPNCEGPTRDLGSFYHNVSTTDAVCPGVETHSGYIGLKGDSDKTPKRSFFWYFPAENNPDDAPVILTVGGGPGTSGMMNPIFGQSGCILTEDGLVRNPNRWNEHYNLVALDHPVGVGFSYGTGVNSSRDAAFDVYDFFQKFFVLYPNLGKNRFYVSGGSYGGIYVPNIATVIQEQNALSIPGNLNINLEAVLVSNPFSDPASHFGWHLYYFCHLHDIYNSTTCAELQSIVPRCLELIDLYTESPTLENKKAAIEYCEALKAGDAHGRVIEDIRRVCLDDDPSEDNPIPCHPSFTWALDFFGRYSTRTELGIPDGVNFTSISMDVHSAFMNNADIAAPHYLLYEPLLKSGIRVLHWIGAQDGNCPWPGVLHFLKLLQTPFQETFLSSPDIPWGNGEMTVRAIGEGAGNMTYLLLDGAGHFVVKDQPKLAKYIVETWIENEPWF